MQPNVTFRYFQVLRFNLGLFSGIKIIKKTFISLTDTKLIFLTAPFGKQLVTGHTHRPMLGTKDSPYFNTGSCVHPRCITCIEIEHRCLTLVKWCLDIHEDMSLYVSREELAGPICVDEY